MNDKSIYLAWFLAGTCGFFPQTIPAESAPT